MTAVSTPLPELVYLMSWGNFRIVESSACAQEKPETEIAAVKKAIRENLSILFIFHLHLFDQHILDGVTCSKLNK
jgi:hypothetical protein